MYNLMKFFIKILIIYLSFITSKNYNFIDILLWFENLKDSEMGTNEI